MTAAIILIAFIIVASAIAFVVLSMGGDIAGELGETGETGLEQATTALMLVGPIEVYDYFYCQNTTTGADPSWMTETVINGLTSTSANTSVAQVTDTIGANSSYREVAAAEQVVFTVQLAQAAQGSIDFGAATIRVSINGKEAFELSRDSNFDDLSYDIMKTVATANSSTDSWGFQYSGEIGDNDDLLEKNEKFKITLYMDVISAINGWDYSHEFFALDEVTITLIPAIANELTITFSMESQVNRYQIIG
jgi:archaellin